MTRGDRLPPWDRELTPRSAIAWLTYDPLTGANLGVVVADNVIAVLDQCGFKIVGADGETVRTYDDEMERQHGPDLIRER